MRLTSQVSEVVLMFVF